MPQLTHEEIDALMQENLAKIQALAEQKVGEAVQRSMSKENQDFVAFRQGYKVYNATNLPVLPRGTEIILDLRPAAQFSGMVACYKSLGDRYVEAWVKTI